MIINNIDTKDISVVVQGPIDKKYTKKCLKSIRKYLPYSEIILSTWKGEDIDNLDTDIVVLNDDPGAVLFKDKIMNNTNRQIVSIQNGILKSTRKYILKFRTDSILIDNSFLNYFNKFTLYNEKYKIFKYRVLVSCIYSREYSEETKFPLPFHPSDFFIFGYFEDIKDYFLKLINLNNYELGSYTLKYKNKMPYTEDTYRYTPEQYICYFWAKTHFENIVFEDCSDWNDINVEQSNNILYNNFVFLDPYQSSFINYKHLLALNIFDSIDGLITFSKFQEYYQRLCDNKYIIKEVLSHKIENLKFYKKIFNIIKYYNKVIVFIFGLKITIKIYKY